MLVEWLIISAFLVKNYMELFHDGGRHHIETSPLICSCSANQMDWFLYDNGLRHERVK